MVNTKSKSQAVIEEPVVEEVVAEADVEEEESEEESSEEESDGEPIILLQAGREKRFNAGNRMRALLDEEVDAEEGFLEEADDVEFEAKNEEDVFDSDFGSTDEEQEGEGEEDGEKRIEREAKAERREARGKRKKTTYTPFLPNFAKQTKQARNAIASTSASTLDGPSPIKRRRGVNKAANTFGFEARESSRKSAVEFKKTVEVRLKESEKKRASHSRPARKQAVSLTQADLIDEALQTEEINRASLLAFYAAEEDRRLADRIAGMRHEILGPKITFLSRLEGVERKPVKGKGKEGEEAVGSKTAAEKLESGRRRLIEVIGEAGKEGWRPNSGMGDPAPVASTSKVVASSAPSTSSSASTSSALPTTNGSQSTVVIASPLTNGGTSSTRSKAITHPFPSPSLDAIASTSTSVVPAPSSRGYARNYLIIDKFEGTKPEEMAALFGNHHEWGSVKVVPARSRVLNRKIPSCVITGLPAPYRDPRTLAPFATKEAYSTLTSVIDQKFAWNDTVGAFTGQIGVGLESDFENTPNGQKVPIPKVIATVANGTTVTTTLPINKTTLASYHLGNATPTPSATKGRGKAKVHDVTPKSTPEPSSNPYEMTWNGEGKGGRESRARGRESLSEASGSNSGILTPKVEAVPASVAVIATGEATGVKGGKRGRSRSKSVTAPVVEMEIGDVEMMG